MNIHKLYTMYIYIYVYTCIIYEQTHVHVYIYICILYVYIYVCMYIYTYMNIYIYIYTYMSISMTNDYIFICIYMHDASLPVFSHQSLIFSQKILMFSQKRQVFFHTIPLYPCILLSHKSPVFYQKESYVLTKENGVFSHGNPVSKEFVFSAEPRLSYSMDLQQQHTATHCNTQQHTATYCNILQHTSTYCNTPCSNIIEHLLYAPNLSTHCIPNST